MTFNQRFHLRTWRAVAALSLLATGVTLALFCLPRAVVIKAAALSPNTSIFQERDNLLAPDGQPQDRFGRSVALSADGLTLVAGASDDDIGAGPNQGSAYVYALENGHFTYKQQLFVSGVSIQEFGRSVSINGTTIAIGAPGEDNNRGAVYLFTKNGDIWTQQQRLAPFNPSNGDYFGASVSLAGETLAIGTSETIGFNANQGATYIFTRNGVTWSQQAKLLASDGEASDSFGASVALSGESVLIGAPGDTVGLTSQQGSAYVFVRSGTTWSQQQKLSFTGAAANDGIGQRVALDGNTALIGAWRDDLGFNSDQGAAYVFTRTGATWNQQQKLTAANGAAGDNFGWGVALAGDRALIGAFNKTILATQFQGAAYVFTRTGSTWTEQQQLTPFVPGAGYFGYSVALGGNTAAAGAYAANTNTGAVYAYRPANTNPQINNVPTLTRSAGSGATTPIIGQVSDAEQAANSLQMTVNNAASATVNGVTVSSLFVNATGQLLANVNVLCNTSNASFTLRAVDDEGGAALAILNVNITPNLPPTLVYAATHAVGLGAALTINPTAGPSDNGGVSQVSILSVMPALSGTLTVNNAGVVTVGNAGPLGAHTVTIRAVDNCALITTTSFTLNVIQAACAVSFPQTLLPVGTQGQPYNVTFAALGGTAPYSYAVTAGTVPSGLNLSAAGVLSGTLAAAGDFTFTVQATDANGCTATRQATIHINGLIQPVAGLQFYPLAHPVRLLDTRPGQAGCDAPGAPLAGGTSRTQTAAGRTCGALTIPANASALTGNITTVQSGGGYLTLYPSDVAQPLAANTNYAANEILNNVFTVGLGAADGAFKLFAVNDTHVVVDVTGYYAQPGMNGLYFHPLPKPVRLLDTRAGAQACFTPGASLPQESNTAQLGQTTCDGVMIPAGARALVGNATTVNPQNGGYLTLYPADAAQPLVASSNFTAGQIMNAPFTVGLAPGGFFNIFTTTATDLVIDVQGYYSADANDVNGAGLLFNPLPAPVRLLETRAGFTGCYTPGAPLATATPYTQAATSACVNIPATARGIIGNATVVNAQAGYLTFWPSNAAQPLVATSNYQSGQIFNRHFTVGLGMDGAFKLFASAQTDLVIDVTGYFVP